MMAGDVKKRVSGSIKSGGKVAKFHIKRASKKLGQTTLEAPLVLNLIGKAGQIHVVAAPTPKMKALIKVLVRGVGGKVNVMTFADVNAFGSARVRPVEKIAKSPKPGTRSVGERVRELGVDPGQKLSNDEARTAAHKIARSSLDLFSSEDEAQGFLRVENFDGTGVSGEQLIQDGRTSRVISRLDELRFGFQG